MNQNLTERQLREIEYHKAHADYWQPRKASLDYEIIQSPQRRWWNAYWFVYTQILQMDLTGKTVLVPGCGFGEDAILLATLGARVFAFDLSPDVLAVARSRAQQEGVEISFEQMPMESLAFPDNAFDLIFLCNILHHCDLPASLTELCRVCKPQATVVINEVYTHSLLQQVRESRLVDGWLYPHLIRLIYNGEKPYITADERKLTDRDLAVISQFVQGGRWEHFNCVVRRFTSDDVEPLAKLDRLALRLLQPVAGVLAGRVTYIGGVLKA